MNMRKKTPILIGTVLFLTFLVASATYAFFATSAQITNNLVFEAIFDSTTPTFTASVEKDLNLQVYATDMLQHSSTSVKSADGIIKIDALASKDDADMVCTYDIDLVWDSDGYVPSTTLPAEDQETGTIFPYELSIKGTRVVTGDDGYTYTNKDLAEKNISDIEFTIVGDEKRATIISGAEIHNKSATEKTLTTWTFTLSFYSLPVTQDALLGNTYSGHLVVTNAVC